MPVSHPTCRAFIHPDTRPHHRRVPTGGSRGVPHSVWLAPRPAVKAPVARETSLPVWALERALAQYAPHGGYALVLHGPGPARTDTAPTPGALAPDWLRAGEHTDLADTRGPAARLILVLADPLPHEPDPAPHTAVAFYRDLRARLHPGGVLLVHTHPHHTAAGLHDPAGAAIRAARTAGLAYTQHTVLVHHPLTTRTSPRFTHPRQRPATPVHRRTHTDLYTLTHPRNGDQR